jgi:hypothetical protein
MEDMVDVVEEFFADDGVVVIDLFEEEAVAVALFERRLALRKKFCNWLVIDD